MKAVIKMALCFAAMMITYLAIYWKIFVPMDGFKRMGYMPNIVSLIVALIVAIVLWKKMGNFANSQFAYIIGGGIALGFIGFISGFFGPLLLAPSNNLGPLLGIFITGPAGFLLGLGVGGMYWNTKVKNKKAGLLK